MKKPFSDSLRRATWRPMSEDARSQHLATIASAVAAGNDVPVAVRSPRRRLSTVLVTASLVVLPTGIALAAESSVPGDVLYPVKKVTEKIRAVVDEDVVAEHRIEELERLVAADAPTEVIADQIERAAVEIDRLEVDHQLGSRLDEATAGVAADRIVDDPPGNGDSGGEPEDKPAITTVTTAAITSIAPGTTTSTAVPPDRPGTTTTTTTRINTSTTTTVRLDTQRVSGFVHAGPICPVVRFPPDPACDDLPVAGAVLVVTAETGKELQRVESNTAGRFDLDLPSGSYALTPRPYDGLLGTAPAQEFVVERGPVELDVAYDTGIR